MSELPTIRVISLLSGRAELLMPPTDVRLGRVDEFIHARSLSPNSQKTYRRELERFLSWTDKAWAEITPAQVVEFKAYLLERGLQPTTVNKALCTLKSFFGWLQKTYPTSLSNGSPVAAVSLEKVPSPPARDLSESEVEALYAALERRGQTKLRDRAILSVLAHGLRASEVCALNVSDYDGQRLHIRRAKDDSTGTVPLHQQAREHLNDYLARRQEKGSCSQESPLFLNASNNYAGGRLSYRGLYEAIKDLGAMANIPNLTPHRLRHTYATMLMLKGMDSLHARTLTRHKSEANFKRYSRRALALAAEQAFYAALGENLPGNS